MSDDTKVPTVRLNHVYYVTLTDHERVVVSLNEEIVRLNEILDALQKERIR